MKPREPAEVFVVRDRGRRDDIVRIEVRIATVEHVLVDVVVFRMRRAEADRQAERLVGRIRADELDGVVAVDLGKVLDRAVGGLAVVGIARGTGDAPAVEVEHAFGGARVDLHAELSDEPGPVAGPLEQRRIAAVHALDAHGRHRERVAMLAAELAGQDARPRRGADGRRAERVCEPRAPRCQRVDVGRADDVVPRAAEQVPAMVVGHQEDDVRGPGIGLSFQ